jgi:ferritin-like metal-binding protein YciE
MAHRLQTDWPNPTIIMTNDETLVKYLSDMYALESHVAHPVKTQAEDKDFTPYPQAHALVKRIYSRTESAMNELETLAKSLGGDARSAIKSAVSAVAGAAASVVNEARQHAITKKLRDDYTALCLVSAGYSLLLTTANALNAPQVAAVAQSRLKEVAGFIMELSQEMIPVAVKELSEDLTVDSSTVELSQKQVQACWTA